MRFVLYFLLTFISTSCFAIDLPLEKLKLPSGFSIQLYAIVPGARELALGTNNIVFVGTISEGKVYAVVPDSHSPTKTKVFIIASGLTMPNGVAFYQNNLYVADLNRILRFDNIEDYLDNPPKPVVITDALPTSKHHGWRYLRIGPDNKLYVSIGAPCNHCLQKDARYASIMRMNLDGSNQEIYAHGVRNSVGFDWDPTSHELVFTDNGRDWMGEDLPPEELNYASKSGEHFGFPFCYGKNTLDTNYDKTSCSAYKPAVLELPAHVAPLGVKFYTGKLFPSQYHNSIFIAEHGSWNRLSKVGYQVIMASKKNNVWTTQPFIYGWLQKQSVWGRPVDLLVMPDGSLLISDDDAGVIYRVSYRSTKP